VCSRAWNADRSVDLHHAKSPVFNLIELDFVVASDDDARNVFLAGLPLVVVEWTDVLRAPEKLLLLRVAVIKVFTLIIFRSIRDVGDV
jgi:hypothetical protein